MQATKDHVISINYVLRDDEGNIIDQSDDNQPLTYLHGHGNIVPGLEEAIEGRDEGETVEVTVPPEKGYGEHRDDLVQAVDRAQFEGVDSLEPGMSFHAETQTGEAIVVTIVDIDGDQVTIDGNHALAGQTLNFNVDIAAVREATDTELEHGHVHAGDHAH